MLAFSIVFGRLALKWIIRFLCILFKISFYSSKHSRCKGFDTVITELTQSGVGNGL